MRIDGKDIADHILTDVKERVETLTEEGIQPHLAVILVGNDDASKVYVTQKEKKAEEVGIKFSLFAMPEKVTEQEIIDKIHLLNDDPTVHGIIVQRPLPAHIHSQHVAESVYPDKDIDGFHPESQFDSPIGQATMRIFEHIYLQEKTTENFSDWIMKKNIVVLGKGETAGQPVITYLEKYQIYPEIITSKTESPHEITKMADIIISAVGKKDVIKPEMVRKGVILISIGLAKNDHALEGDYNEEEVKGIASFYTPTPKGIGPINVALLLQNVVLSAENTV